MANNYNDVLSFLSNPPSKEFGYLRKINDFVNRPGIKKVIQQKKNELSFIIPSEVMIKELCEFFKNRQYTKLDTCVLSLFLCEKELGKKKSQSVNLLSGNNVVIENKSGHIEIDGHKAEKKEFGNVEAFKLHTNTFILGSKKRKIEPVKGSFENKEDVPELKDDTSFCNLVTNTVFTDGGFKKIVADIYCCLDEENRKIADSFICNNPYAEYFLLVDSKFIKVDLAAVAGNTAKTLTYEKIMETKNAYCDNFAKLKSIIESTSFIENNYKLFYENVASNLGSFIYEDETFAICHPDIAEYLYSIEMFSFCMKKLGEDLEKAELAAKPFIFKRMVEINRLTNIKTTEHAIFGESDNLVVSFEEFEKRFKHFGLCICRNNIVDGSAEPSSTLNTKTTNRKKRELKAYVKKKNF